MALCVSIKLIAFDIGGVLAIINKKPLKNLFSHELLHHNFLRLQRGLIKPANLGMDLLLFEHVIRAHKNKKLLKKLCCPYIFASNINSLHYEKFQREVNPSIYAQRNSALSYKLGFIKPEPEFFEILKKKNPLNSQEILFIDDRRENIRAALACGLSAEWLRNFEDLPNILCTHKL